jgi:gamma-glutamyltranspeptidase/glutathione hydrolase
VTSIGPGKRILSAASPLVVTRQGRPRAAVASPGGRRIILAVVQCLVNAIDLELGMQAAIPAPRMHAEGQPTLVSHRFPARVIDGLRSIGHDVTVCEDNLGGGQFGWPSGVMVDGATGELRAGVFQFTLAPPSASRRSLRLLGTPLLPHLARATHVGDVGGRALAPPSFRSSASIATRS